MIFESFRFLGLWQISKKELVKFKRLLLSVVIISIFLFLGHEIESICLGAQNIIDWTKFLWVFFYAFPIGYSLVFKKILSIKINSPIVLIVSILFIYAATQHAKNFLTIFAIIVAGLTILFLMVDKKISANKKLFLYYWYCFAILYLNMMQLNIGNSNIMDYFISNGNFNLISELLLFFGGLLSAPMIFIVMTVENYWYINPLILFLKGMVIFYSFLYVIQLFRMTPIIIKSKDSWKKDWLTIDKSFSNQQTSSKKMLLAALVICVPIAINLNFNLISAPDFISLAIVILVSLFINETRSTPTIKSISCKTAT